jgi:hypothetical protein
LGAAIEDAPAAPLIRMELGATEFTQKSTMTSFAIGLEGASRAVGWCGWLFSAQESSLCGMGFDCGSTTSKTGDH